LRLFTLIIEHKIDLIKRTYFIINLGKDGGKNGGELLFQGLPEDLIKSKGSNTATYLKEKLS